MIVIRYVTIYRIYRIYSKLDLEFVYDITEPGEYSKRVILCIVILFVLLV